MAHYSNMAVLVGMCVRAQAPTQCWHSTAVRSRAVRVCESFSSTPERDESRERSASPSASGSAVRPCRRGRLGVPRPVLERSSGS